MPDRFPDFFFGRIPEMEVEHNLVLCGKLVTNFPRGRKPTSKQLRILEQVVETLVQNKTDRPDMREMAIWWPREMPRDALHPPYDVALLEARCKIYHSTVVTVDMHGDRLIRALPLSAPESLH